MMTGPCDNVTVVVLAGGQGTRIRSIYPETPKPLVPVIGKPFLHWLTLWLARHGLDDFVYSTGYRSKSIEAWASNDDFPNLSRICRREETPLGTGGGLFNCLDYCRDWILVANGDGLVMGGISELLTLRHEVGVDGGLLGVDVEDASRYGSLLINTQSRLSGFREKSPGAVRSTAAFICFARPF